jgi:phosphosulfolactate phosphohydrolase-like enzyme
MVERLTAAGRQRVSDDSGLVALFAWRAAAGQAGGVRGALAESRGGRNLARVGLTDDLDFCARIDALPVVPRFDPATGRITLPGA